MRETVLYYSPEKQAYAAKLKGVMVQLGIRIRNITPDQAGEKVGYLAGIPGYEAAQAAPVPEIPEEMLVLKDFTGPRMEQLLQMLRRAGVPRIALKAVLTETNVDWTFYELYQEIRKEHEFMKASREKE